MENIGLKIKITLKRMKITQKEFSERLGIPKSSLSAYLSGTREIPFRVLVMMCRELNLDLNAMFNISNDNVLIEADEMAIIKSFRNIKKKDRTIVAQSIINMLNRMK